MKKTAEQYREFLQELDEEIFAEAYSAPSGLGPSFVLGVVLGKINKFLGEDKEEPKSDETIGAYTDYLLAKDEHEEL